MELSGLNAVLLVFLGVAAGVASGLFGIGGGVVIIPLLIFLLGFSQYAANGTSLVALLLPVGALGVWTYYQAGKIGPFHLKAGLLMALGIFVGTAFGSRIAVSLPQEVLRKSFAVFLVIMAVRLWFLRS